MEKIGSFEIVENPGWDLLKEIPEYDWQCDEEKIMIPSNYGVGIRMLYNGQPYTTKFHFDFRYKCPTVVLNIDTWRGMSYGAIHYYGDLEIRYPYIEDDNRPGHTVSSSDGLPMFDRYKIKLTNVLEQWEIEKYPENYEYHHAGDHHTGFYSVEAIKRRAQEFFKEHFGEGWKLKIDKHF